MSEAGYVEIAGPVGSIEAVLRAPESPRFAAVVCHPHPLYGGTMHTHAVFRLARALVASDGVALRFNFRGVGRSAGRHDDGRGEVDDVRAAIEYLAGHHAGLPLWACGFSFGARAALAAAVRDERVSRALVLGVALGTLSAAERQALVVEPSFPIAVVQAERDEFGAPSEIEALFASSRALRRLFVVAGATHLFTEDLDALERRCEEAAAWLRSLEGPA